VNGNIEFTDDDADVKILSAGGRFQIETSNGTSRRYEVTADGSGNLTRKYLVNGSSRPIDAEGHAWLAATLPSLIREMAIGVGPRVRRFLNRLGPEGVLREIALIRSDGSKSAYIRELVSVAKLTDVQLSDVLRLTRSMSSDGERARTLIHVAPLCSRPGLREPLFDAIDGMHSDGERRRVLSAILVSDGRDAATQALVSKSAGKMPSDGEKARVLVEVARVFTGNDEVRRAWFKAVSTFNSDGERRRTLTAMLENNARHPAIVLETLRSAAPMASDGEKAAVLSAAVAGMPVDDNVRRAFVEAANSLNSDGERRRVLLALLRQSDKPADLADAARMAGRSNSDGEKAEVLAEIARRPGVANQVAKTPFFGAVDTIHSDGERARVLLTLAGRSGLPEDLVIATIQSATRMSSDGEKGRVLSRIAQAYGSNPAINSELRRAAESVRSDGEHRRVMNAVGAH